MANKFNVYKNNNKINSFKSARAAFAFYADDIAANIDSNQYSYMETIIKLKSSKNYIKTDFVLLSNGNYILNNYNTNYIKNVFKSIGFDLIKIDDVIDDVDVIIDDIDVIIDDIDDVIDDIDDVIDVNIDVNEKCHLHHILPKSSYPQFANLDKNPWNGILLPSNIHASFHSFMGGYKNSNDKSLDWFKLLFEFLNQSLIKNQIPNIDLNEKFNDFNNGLNDYIDDLKSLL
jgi:hypothetical protein